MQSENLYKQIEINFMELFKRFIYINIYIYNNVYYFLSDMYSNHIIATCINNIDFDSIIIEDAI